MSAARILQAAKNLRVFVPLLAAHGPFTAATLTPLVGTFLAFLTATWAVYLVNDVLDREADRSHPHKAHRAVAAGRVTPRAALVAALGLAAVAGALLALFDVPTSAGWILAGYLGLALLYGTVLKRLLLIDVFALSALSMARLFAGGAATATPISPWLMALSGFLFLSLAFLKRFGELHARGVGEAEPVPGRAYRGKDLTVLRTAGMTSGYGAVLVLALYVNGAQAEQLYGRPELLWLACPALLYWITRMWILVSRGDAIDDPIALALTDPASYAAGAWVFAAGMLAHG